MKYVRKAKKSMLKRPVFKRKARYPRRITVRSNANTDDATVLKINPGKSRVQRWLKTTPLNVQGTLGVAGTNGFTIRTESAAYTQAGTITFDPAGYSGNNSGSITSANGFSLLSALALPEWTSFGNLYAQYKVNKITLKFTSSVASATNVNNMPITLFMRYNDEYTPGNPTITSISEERNWIKKVFTPEHPTFTYSFYPKVLAQYDNLGLIAVDSRRSTSMPFMNMNSPSELLGMKFYVQSPASSALNIVSCDIQYDISFKEQT